MYGLNDDATRDFGTQCLLARRMAESGVRFIELGKNGWDHHNQLRAKRMMDQATAIDKPIAALIDGHEAAGAVRRHAVRVGRRVWADELRAEQLRRRAAHTTTAATPCGWRAAA